MYNTLSKRLEQCCIEAQRITLPRIFRDHISGHTIWARRLGDSSCFSLFLRHQHSLPPWSTPLQGLLSFCFIFSLRSLFPNGRGRCVSFLFLLLSCSGWWLGLVEEWLERHTRCLIYSACLFCISWQLEYCFWCLWVPLVWVGLHCESLRSVMKKENKGYDAWFSLWPSYLATVVNTCRFSNIEYLSPLISYLSLTVAVT